MQIKPEKFALYAVCCTLTLCFAADACAAWWSLSPPPPKPGRSARVEPIVHSNFGSPCNGSARLCDKRYNEVAFPTAHNAGSNQRNELFDTWDALECDSLGYCVRYNINDQDLSITDQLTLGIRAVEISVLSNVYTDGKVINTCHGLNPEDVSKYLTDVCTGVAALPPAAQVCQDYLNNLNFYPCLADPAATQLQRRLNEVYAFLLSHPTEVITVFLSDKTNHRLADIQNIVNTPPISGLLYVKPIDDGKLWPTLGELIRLNKRLVVFVDSEDLRTGSTAYPLNNQGHFVYMSPWYFANAIALSNDQYFANGSLPAPASTALSFISHQVTPWIGGNDDDATVVNSYDFIAPRIKAYKKTLGATPNFISTDFVEYSADGKDLFSLVDELNGLTSQEGYWMPFRGGSGGTNVGGPILPPPNSYISVLSIWYRSYQTVNAIGLSWRNIKEPDVSSGDVPPPLAAPCGTQSGCWNSAHLVCPTGARMAGLYGRSGSLVDQLGVLCRDKAGNVTQTNWYGGTGGMPFLDLCKPGYSLYGISAWATDNGPMARLAGLCLQDD